MNSILACNSNSSGDDSFEMIESSPNVNEDGMKGIQREKKVVVSDLEKMSKEWEDSDVETAIGIDDDEEMERREIEEEEERGGENDDVTNSARRVHIKLEKMLMQKFGSNDVKKLVGLDLEKIKKNLMKARKEEEEEEEEEEEMGEEERRAEEKWMENYDEECYDPDRREWVQLSTMIDEMGKTQKGRRQAAAKVEFCRKEIAESERSLKSSKETMRLMKKLQNNPAFESQVLKNQEVTKKLIRQAKGNIRHWKGMMRQYAKVAKLGEEISEKEKQEKKKKEWEDSDMETAISIDEEINEEDNDDEYYHEDLDFGRIPIHVLGESKEGRRRAARELDKCKIFVAIMEKLEKEEDESMEEDNIRQWPISEVSNEKYRKDRVESIRRTYEYIKRYDEAANKVDCDEINKGAMEERAERNRDNIETAIDIDVKREIEEEENEWEDSDAETAIDIDEDRENPDESVEDLKQSIKEYELSAETKKKWLMYWDKILPSNENIEGSEEIKKRFKERLDFDEKCIRDTKAKIGELVKDEENEETFNKEEMGYDRLISKEGVDMFNINLTLLFALLVAVFALLSLLKAFDYITQDSLKNIFVTVLIGAMYYRLAMNFKSLAGRAKQREIRRRSHFTRGYDQGLKDGKSWLFGDLVTPAIIVHIEEKFEYGSELSNKVRPVSNYGRTHHAYILGFKEGVEQRMKEKNSGDKKYRLSQPPVIEK